jgi:flagellar motor switch protein FliG
MLADMESGAGTASGTEKATILLATLENSLAVDLLKRLEPDEVRALLDSSNGLGPLTTEDVDPVVDQFTQDLSSALGITAGSEQLMTLLESALTVEEIAKLMGRPIAKVRENIWQKLTADMETVLVPYLLDQHEQVCAYVLSKLNADIAAKCMVLFPRGARSRLARRLLRMSDAFVPAADLLQDILMEDIFAKAGQSKSADGKATLAAVINKLDRNQSAEVLEDLAKSNPDDLASLRKLIFMFEDIALLETKSRMKLIDRVPAELVIAALHGTDSGFREVIFASMSARTKRLVESELQGDTSQPTKDSMPARRKIADMAIAMAQKGEIELPDPDAADTDADGGQAAAA